MDPRIVETVARSGASWTEDERTLVFEWLMREMLEEMIRRAYRFTHALAEAEDVVQETLIAVCVGLRTYDPACSGAGDVRGSTPAAAERFRAWAGKIHQNQCVQWLRRHRRRECLHGQTARDEQGSAAPPGDTILEQLTKKQRLKLLAAAFAELSEGHRQVMHRRLRGESYQEIATALGIARATARKRHFDAIQQLRRRIGTSHEVQRHGFQENVLP